jgi:hypothetical protein
MNISDNFEYWFRKQQWISGRVFAAFQASSLLSLILLIFAGQRLIETWDGSNGYWIFIILMSLMVFVAISKFKFMRGRIRMLVDATFIGELVACLVLLLLL